MKSHRTKKADTAKEFLEQLAADRGTLLTDEQYAGVRSSLLEDLARPPRIDWAIAGPGLVFFLAGIGFLVAALLRWFAASENTAMSCLMLGLLFVGSGSYCVFANLHACRAAARRPYAERMSEIDDLLRCGLITAQEHETTRRAIEHEITFRAKNAGT